MSNNRHEAEILDDSKRRAVIAQIEALTALTCPFCGEKEIYVYPPVSIDPEIPLWMNRRWWTAGCQSRTCDSSWRIEKDHYRQVHLMLLRCQPTPPATEETT